jgi:hypothetical protein
MTKHDGSTGLMTIAGGSRSKPPGNPRPGDDLHCKRCGGTMVLATVIRKFGDQPRLELFRCVVCDFYDVVKE